MRLKLMRLPRGTNRNRTLRRMAEVCEEEMDFSEVERLFRRFWRQWTAGEMSARMVVTGKGAER